MAALLALAGCAGSRVAAGARSAPVAPLPLAPALPVAPARVPVILISIDGFRPDYLARGVTPTLSRLAAGGVVASMRPSFPSKTFPNHWTLVTGLVPDRTGIVGNAMDDPERPSDHFTMASDDPFWWNAAEPIWVTAQAAGIRTATMFWPGASVAWGGTRPAGAHHDAVDGGTRPADWWAFAQAITGDQRVDGVLDWLRRPAATRPRFVTLYFDTVDTAGHDAGPGSVAVTDAVRGVDASIGRLVAGLAALGQPADLVIVADHGMAATASDRVIALDAVAPPASYRVEETGTYASLFPVAGHEAELAAALAVPRAHLRCWPKERIPPRFHYGRNPRVPPWLCLADPGWLVERTAPKTPFVGGNHGYDNDTPSMRALFLANGPAFRAGVRLPDFDNVDVAPLLRDLLGLPAGTGLDGDDRRFRDGHALKGDAR